MSKFVLVLLVFLLVFSPTKIPSLITNISKLYVKSAYYKQKLLDFWQKSISKEIQAQQLQENLKKAHEADLFYNKKR